MARSVIEFADVCFSFDGKSPALHDISFELSAGETLVLLGRSGSGKTTVLKLINGLLKPTRGAVLIDGKSTSEWNPIGLRRQIGYVIQEIGLFPHYTVARNVGLVPRLEGWPEDRIESRVRDMLELVSLGGADFLKRFPSQLSGGQ